MHGDLPDIESCDVVGICGDIVPLNIQRDTIKSVVWFTNTFVPWAMNIDCKRVIFIAGNHDFFLQDLMKNRLRAGTDEERENAAADIISEVLSLPEKIVYLQDTAYEFEGVKFYGTPWIPVLKNWAFYKDSNGLTKKFLKIPNNIDVLMTHSPGKFVNDTGVSKELPGFPEYGSAELTDAVEGKTRYWFCGHVHTGEHLLTEFGTIRVANVSIKNENYKLAFSPLVVTI